MTEKQFYIWIFIAMLMKFYALLAVGIRIFSGRWITNEITVMGLFISGVAIFILALSKYSKGL